MNVGTKSLLFGVHQFLWHPITVARAWRFYHGRWPDSFEWICIFCHDLGYWGKPNMDGEEGQSHPEGGARLAGWLTYYWARLRGHGRFCAMVLRQRSYNLALYHSRFYAARHGHEISELFMPDKLCVLFEPRWWYLFRARLSGEVYEYMSNAQGLTSPERTPRNWHAWYQRKVFSMLANPKYHKPL